MKFLPTQYTLSRCRSSLSPIAAALAVGALLAAQPADAAIPKARADRVTVDTNESVPINVTRNDGGLADGPIKVTLISRPGHGWAWVSGKVVGYRSKPGFQGTDTLVYRIMDRDGQNARAKVVIQVKRASSGNQGNKPVAKADRLSAVAGKVATVNVLRNDSGVGTGRITVRLVRQPRNGKASVDAKGLLKYRPKSGFSGTDTLRYRVVDARGRKAEANVNVTVKGPSRPKVVDAKPRARSDSVSLEQGKSVSINVLANDTGLSNGPVSVSVVGKPKIGTAKILSGNRIRFTAPAGKQGSASFSYKVTDADGDSAVASVSVDVACGTCTVDKKIVLTWDAHSEPVTGFRVLYGPTPASAVVPLSALYVNNGEIDPGAPSVSYALKSDLGVQPGEQVCFKVGAFSDVEKSKLSAPVCTVL